MIVFISFYNFISSNHLLFNRLFILFYLTNIFV